MNDDKKTNPRIAVITLIQEGAVKVGGEHAMLFPYVEQVLKTAETIREKLEIIPYVISPRPKKLEKLARVVRDAMKREREKSASCQNKSDWQEWIE